VVLQQDHRQLDLVGEYESVRVEQVEVWRYELDLVIGGEYGGGGGGLKALSMLGLLHV